MNFMDEEDMDGFFDFPWYKNKDPRELPPSAGTCFTPALGQIFTDTIDEAFNKKADVFTVTPEIFRDGTEYDEDKVELHLDKKESPVNVDIL